MEGVQDKIVLIRHRVRVWCVCAPEGQWILWQSVIVFIQWVSDMIYCRWNSWLDLLAVRSRDTDTKDMTVKEWPMLRTSDCLLVTCTVKTKHFCDSLCVCVFFSTECMNCTTVTDMNSRINALESKVKSRWLWSHASPCQVFELEQMWLIWAVVSDQAVRRPPLPSAHPAHFTWQIHWQRGGLTWTHSCCTTTLPATRWQHKRSFLKGSWTHTSLPSFLPLLLPSLPFLFLLPFFHFLHASWKSLGLFPSFFPCILSFLPSYLSYFLSSFSP